MILEIIKEPNPLLHRATQPLTAEQIQSKEIQKLINNMIPTMYYKDGVGLAANQVGQSWQICVIAKDYVPFPQPKDLVLINPKIERASLLREWSEEGCLSVPGVYGLVRRWKKVAVSALDENGNPLDFVASDFFARIIQHEYDHLQGRLFIEKAKKLHVIERRR